MNLKRNLFKQTNLHPPIKKKLLSSLLQKNAKGQELFDQIVYHLDLVETDYFGLQFMDASQVTVSITSVNFYVLQQLVLPIINVLLVQFHGEMQALGDILLKQLVSRLVLVHKAKILKSVMCHYISYAHDLIAHK